MSELVVISQIRLQDHYSRETLNMNKRKYKTHKKSQKHRGINMSETVKTFEEKELTIDFASYDEKAGKIVILAHADGESPSSMNIGLQAYNEDAREFYEDEETKKAGLEKLAKTGLTLEDIQGKKFFGKTFTAYTNEGKITFNKPQRFVRANQIQNREAMQLDGVEVVTEPITEQKSKHKFRVVFEHPVKVKDKPEPVEMGFLASQLIFDDPEDLDTAPRGVGFKYSNKEINDFEEQLKNAEDMPEQVTDAIKQFLEGAIEQLKNLFGLDIEEAIQKGQRLRLRLHKQQIPSSNQFYMQADLLEIIDSEEE